MNGNAVLFAIMTVDELEEPRAEEVFAPNAPFGAAEGMKACALPAQHIARTATDFIIQVNKRGTVWGG